MIGNPLVARARRVLELLWAAAASAQDATALQALSKLPGPYTPWTTIAMRPSGVATLVNEAMLNGRRQIVECGPGVSTIFLARLLRQEGGHLYTIEEDGRWAERVSGWLAREGTAENITVIHAPLVEDGWYAHEPLETIPGGIDLLVVDGPKAFAPESTLARYPALPFFAPKLTTDATVILDDIDRGGERQVVARWESEFGRHFEMRYPYDNLAVSRQPEAFYA
jgi:predicted O-methyltransferase YrrM